jgi:hypothetical protein
MISCVSTVKDGVKDNQYSIKDSILRDSVFFTKNCISTTEKYKGKTVWLSNREAKFVIIKSRKGNWYRKYLTKTAK